MMKHIILIITTVLCCLGLSAQTDSVFYIQGSVGRLATHLQLPQIRDSPKIADSHTLSWFYGLHGRRIV